jgi:glycosyltransferase involved in cell wall biosynthesis
MADTNKVSIIMPVKNAGKYLHECLSSIRRQTFPFWELIVVNDHSEDTTEEILQAHCLEDERIRVFNNPGNGIIPALQHALSVSTGDFITRMDGDDLMPEDKLELMTSALSTQPVKTIVTGKVDYFGTEPVSEGYLGYQRWLNERIDRKDHWDWIYRECVIASPNWMIRKADLMAMGGFDCLSYPEDYHLVLRWYQHGFRLVALDATTLHWREHPERTSRTSHHYNQEHFFRLKIDHFLNHQLENQSLILWGAGSKGRLTASLLDQHGQAFQWMDINPEKYPGGIDGHPIGKFTDIEAQSGYKLLIAVFPPDKERSRLEKYLLDKGLKMGVDYWYL